MAQDPPRSAQGAGASGGTNPNIHGSSSAKSGSAAMGSSSPSSYSKAGSRDDRSSDYGDHSGGRDVVVVERQKKPNTATVVGAALVGAIAGGAIPFMLSGRSSSPTSRRENVVQESIIINRPPQELYVFWRDFTNFPQFMNNIKSVDKLDDRRSHWVIKAPAGSSVEFDSRITEDVPGKLIAWQSEEGASVPNRGRVEFIETSSGQGTNVRTTISYDPPAGAAGRMVAKLFHREPAIQAKQDLQRFKELMEKRAR